MIFITEIMNLIFRCHILLLIPIDSPVRKNNEKHSVSSEMEEAFIRLHNPLVNLLMRSAAERRVSAHFTVAKLIVSAFGYIE